MIEVEFNIIVIFTVEKLHTGFLCCIRVCHVLSQWWCFSNNAKCYVLEVILVPAVPEIVPVVKVFSVAFLPHIVVHLWLYKGWLFNPLHTKGVVFISHKNENVNKDACHAHYLQQNPTDP